MKKTIATKIGAAAFSGAFAVTGLSATVGMIPVLAKQSDSTNTSNDAAETRDVKRRSQSGDADIIDNSQRGSIHIFKYDTTSAEAAGDYHEGDIKATGQQDDAVKNALKNYAISGVEFSYLKVGEIETYTTAGANGDVVVVYEIRDNLAEILGLSTTKTFDQDAKGYYPPADIISLGAQNQNDRPCTNPDVHHYTSTQINDALAALLADSVQGKNQLESYLKNYGNQDTDFANGDTQEGANNSATALPLTDANGETSSQTPLPLGLYLIVETKVPEQVTETVNPWFISLPFTNVSKQTEADDHGHISDVDTSHTDNGVASTDNNGGDYWLYDAYMYPKNQTGNPDIDKSVRTAYSKTSADKNGAVASGTKYESALAGNAAEGTSAIATAHANTEKNFVVYNATDGVHTADADDASYIANRGGYTKGNNATAGQGGVTPQYSKDYTYGDTTTASEGDVLDFILVSKLPHISSKATYLSEYTFTDVLSPGLTFNKDPRIAIYDSASDAKVNNTSKAVAIWNYDDTTKMFGDSYANFEVNGLGNGCTQMTVKMTENGLNMINEEANTADSNTVSGYPGDDSKKGLSDYYMVVYYTATVESNESVILGDQGNQNDVTLTWSRTNNATYNTLQDRTYTYVYGIDLTKTFSKPADGDFSKVEFKLYNETDAQYIIATKDADGLYHVHGWTKDKSEATSLTPSSEGRLFIKGLEGDKYQLTEVKTADGFSLLRDQIVIDITPTERDVKAAVAGTTGLTEEKAANIIENYGSRIKVVDGQLVEDTSKKTQIKNEDDQKVNEAKTDVTSTSRNADQSIDRSVAPSTEPGGGSTPNGRTIGKTDMYVGDINSASATIDGKACTMLPSSSGTQSLRAYGLESSENAEVKLNVQNNKNWLLPATGGMGTYAATIAGIVILGMGIYSINKKKENA